MTRPIVLSFSNLPLITIRLPSLAEKKSEEEDKGQEDGEGIDFEPPARAGQNGVDFDEADFRGKALSEPPGDENGR